jgi:beta-phosphoglucomutase-like phosphatase (HAD superfamily)
MTLKAVIFDVDGTLAETADVKRAAFNQAFAEVGLDWVWNRAVFAQILSSALPGCEVEFFALLRQPAEFNRLESSGLLDRIHRRQQQIYRGLLEAGAAPLRPGVARLMAEVVGERLPLALCSTGPRQEFETLLFNRFGLEMVDALTCSVAAEDLQGHSPLKAYRRCLEKLGLPAFEVLVIDDCAKGVAAAASLGMCVIATPGHYNLHEKFTGAKRVLSDLGHPAAPFSALGGDEPGISHVTLTTLRLWHSEVGLASANAA